MPNTDTTGNDYSKLVPEHDQITQSLTNMYNKGIEDAIEVVKFKFEGVFPHACKECIKKLQSLKK